ncbi:hypothetical protein BO443_10543 [Burkholderia orbicola]
MRQFAATAGIPACPEAVAMQQNRAPRARPGGSLVDREIVADLQQLHDGRAREAARGQKARLLRAFGGRLRQCTEFLAPDGLRARQFGLAQLGIHLFDETVADRMALQLADDARDADTRRATMHEALGEACVGQPAFLFQRIEHRFDGLAFVDVGCELARELRAAVFTPRQIAERAALQRPRRLRRLALAGARRVARSSAAGRCAGCAACAARMLAAARIDIFRRGRIGRAIARGTIAREADTGHATAGAIMRVERLIVVERIVRCGNLK